MPVVLSDHHRRCILLVALAYLCVLLHGPSYAVSAESLFIDKATYCESGVSEAVEPGSMPTIWNWTASRSRHLAPGGRASAPYLRPMPSCTTTSSPRAAGKRPTRKSCAAGSASRRCSCSAGRSSSSMATPGSDQTYPPRASISRSKAMVFRKSQTFFQSR